MLKFSPHEMKYILYLPKKSKFSLYFILNGNTDNDQVKRKVVISVFPLSIK